MQFVKQKWNPLWKYLVNGMNEWMVIPFEKVKKN